MKKILATLAVILSFLILFACADPIEKRQTNLSELRDEVFAGGDEQVKITLCSGFREDPYIIDGQIPQNKTDFSVITVEGEFKDEELSYRLTVNGETHEGKLLKHPFKASYSTEIALKTAVPPTIMLTGEGYAGNYELASVKTEEMITASEALEIAEVRLEDEIDDMEEDGTLKAEIYVRLLANPISSEGGYYWYVAYVPAKYEIKAVLIHPITREIVAVRE